MQHKPYHLAFLLPLILTACGPDRDETSARLLDHRLNATLASDIAANRAVVQPLPNGARVVLTDTSATPGGPATSDMQLGSTRASVVEALLDPALIKIAISDTSALPPDQKQERIDDISAYFRSLALGDTLLPSPAPSTSDTAPAGVTLTISVVCPHRNDGSGYDSGQRKPGCF